MFSCVYSLLNFSSKTVFDTSQPIRTLFSFNSSTSVRKAKSPRNISSVIPISQGNKRRVFSAVYFFPFSIKFIVFSSKSIKKSSSFIRPQRLILIISSINLEGRGGIISITCIFLIFESKGSITKFICLCSPNTTTAFTLDFSASLYAVVISSLLHLTSTGFSIIEVSSGIESIDTSFIF